MDWDDDLDVSGRKLIPRLGRRGGNQQNNSHEDKSDEDSLESQQQQMLLLQSASGKRPSPKGPAPTAPPRARKTGWGDDNLKSAKPRGGFSGSIDSDRFTNNFRNSREDDIPIIPDLDEIIEDTGMLDISKVPTKGINRAAAAAAYEELDSDLLKNKLFSTLDGVDLRLLIEKLYPEHLVKEPDEVWSWESLFTHVASEINSETQSKIDDNKSS